MKEKYNAKKDLINVIKEKLSCAKCGYNKIPQVLDFHHINPEEKDESVARMTSNKYNIETIIKEIDKCVCLCANCHREFHYYENKNGLTINEFLSGD